MSMKPIDDLDFWKKRIETAASPHYSVYVIHERGWKIIYDEHLKIISAHIPTYANVLDAGCGFGRMSPLFKKYTGIDFSPDFIALAKKNYPDKKFKVKNLKDTGYKNDQFDWAICVSIKKMVIDNLGEEEWRLMENEIKRVAKKVLILEYEEPTKFQVI